MTTRVRRRHAVLVVAPLLLSALLVACLNVRDGQAGKEQVIVPTEPIELFNGDDLSNFYTWLADHQHDDPNQVYTVVDQIDGAPAIRISGEDWGGLTTEKEYANYHLIVEYRWGPVTWGDRRNRARDSGILLHAQGQDGNREPDFTSPWLRSVEFQIIEGGTGDVILIDGYQDGERRSAELTTTVTKDRDGETVWDPDGEVRTLTGGRINWWARDPDWTDELNFVGKDDIENPIGEWNRLEAFCDSDEITYHVNGQVVMKGTGAVPSQGKLLFQSEGAEIYFRKIELRPLP